MGVSGRILWDSVLANFEPGHQSIWVNYHNDDRAPLLFVSATDERIMPPKIQQSNLEHYKSDTVTEIVEFDGPHLLSGHRRLGEGRRSASSSGPSKMNRTGARIEEGVVEIRARGHDTPRAS